MPLRIVEQAGVTDVGRQRSANEDALVVAPPFFAVADGMGGAKAGAVASSIATDAFEGENDSTEPAEVPTKRSAVVRSMPASASPAIMPSSQAIPVTPPPPNTKALLAMAKA